MAASRRPCRAASRSRAADRAGGFDSSAGLDRRILGPQLERRHLLGEPPVHDEDLAVRADHDILGLEIAMDDPLRMRERHGVADLLEDRHQRAERVLLDHLLALVPQPAQHFVEGDALDVLHRVEGLAVFIDAEFVNGHDIRVIELPGELRFVDEAEHIFPGELGAGFHDLHCHGAPDAEIARLHDHAHAAARDRRDDLVLASVSYARIRAPARDRCPKGPRVICRAVASFWRTTSLALPICNS